MKAEVKYSGTQLSVTLTAENDSEKVLLQLVDKSTPMFNIDESVVVVETSQQKVIANIELDKSKRT